MSIEVKVVPCLEDNYAYLLFDHESKSCATIDPVEPDKVLSNVPNDYKLTHVLTTHKHWDHAGGNVKMKEMVNGGLTVVGGADDNVDGCTLKVKNDDVVKFGNNINVQCVHAKCHTKGHMLYVVDGNLFCGDTLFVGGCGRFFEGDANDMYQALCVKIGQSLPLNTKVWCGHEYTLTNYGFALDVEPNNEDLKNAMRNAEEKRKNNQPTVPSTVEQELKTNPFMRVMHDTVRAYTKTDNDVDCMHVLREKKNSFGLGSKRKL